MKELSIFNNLMTLQLVNDEHAVADHWSYHLSVLLALGSRAMLQEFDLFSPTTSSLGLSTVLE